MISLNTYLVTLAIQTDESQSNPGKWDWASLIDTPYVAEVVAVVDATELDEDEAMRKISARH